MPIDSVRGTTVSTTHVSVVVDCSLIIPHVLIETAGKRSVSPLIEPEVPFAEKCSCVTCVCLIKLHVKMSISPLNVKMGTMGFNIAGATPQTGRGGHAPE